MNAAEGPIGVVRASENLDLYWVQVRESPDERWSEPGLPVAGWEAAVGQLRKLVEVALDGVDGEADELTSAGWRLVDRIDAGHLAERPFDATYSGRFWRIVPVRGGPFEPLASRLRWLLVRDHSGTATIEVTTRTGARFSGVVSWDTIEPEVVWLRTATGTVAVRSWQVESFALPRLTA